MTAHLQTEVMIVGGGLGGVAAALAAAEAGRQVVLSEALPWLGGQLTAQAVPPDDHPWADQGVGSRSYGRLRALIRDYYHTHYRLTAAARFEADLNPGAGNVSKLCHEPQVAVAAIDQMLAPYVSSGRIWLLRGYEPAAAEVVRDRVRSVMLHHARDGDPQSVEADIFIDATELGDLLLLADVEHAIGAESRDDTGELHALETADPLDQQAMTWCFAVDYLPGEDHTINRPTDYDLWRTIKIPGWPGPQFSWTVSDHVTHQPRVRQLFAADTDNLWAWDLWHARRIAFRGHHEPGFFRSDITLANWPQMDYWSLPTLGVEPSVAKRAMSEAKELSKSFLFWMQTEAPRHDGGTGYPGLRLRPHAMGTTDGFAMQPYFREARRIMPEFRVLEQHIGTEARQGAGSSEPFFDTVGVGAYRIDLHPTTTERNTVDIDAMPFEVPLGALIPVRVDNLLAGGKNVGTTRITNGAFREHPTEWAVGEAAGTVAVQSLDRKLPPRALRNQGPELADLQARLVARGVDIHWPRYISLSPTTRSGWITQ